MLAIIPIQDGKKNLEAKLLLFIFYFILEQKCLFFKIKTCYDLKN